MMEALVDCGKAGVAVSRLGCPAFSTGPTYLPPSYLRPGHDADMAGLN